MAVGEVLWSALNEELERVTFKSTYANIYEYKIVIIFLLVSFKYPQRMFG